MRTILVTGASGFVGRHFIEAAANDFALIAVGRSARPEWLPQSTVWLKADILDPSGFDAIDRDYWGVAHFANLSIPSTYRDDSVMVQSVAMTAGILKHVRSARFLFPSSCHVYVPGNEIKREDSPCRPEGRYGQAKLATEQLMLSAEHIDGRIARPFNHIGKYMTAGLMIPSLAKRVQNAKPGEPIVMQGKNSIRDFLDVRDIVRAYIAILELESPTVRAFNVCSGHPVSIREFAERFVSVAGKTNSVVFQDHAQSADDTDSLIGNPARLREMAGWCPLISLDESIRSLLAD